MGLLEGFRCVTELPVRWGDMDSYRHVNNTVYFRYFESARIDYFSGLGFGGGPQGIAPVLHTTTCRFRFPLSYPDTVFVGSRVIALNRNRFKMHHQIISQRHQLIAAEGYCIIVAFDYDHNRVGEFVETVYQAIVSRDRPQIEERISIDV